MVVALCCSASLGVVSTPKKLGVSPNLLKEQEAVEKCTALVEELRKDGLVVLGLSAVQYRQLGMLREAVSSLSVSLDALKYDRWVRSGSGFRFGGLGFPQGLRAAGVHLVGHGLRTRG